jgi:hypothetical protein
MTDAGLLVKPGVECAAAGIDAAVDGERCCVAAGHPCHFRLEQDGHEYVLDPEIAPANAEAESAPASAARWVWSDRLAGLGALTY